MPGLFGETAFAAAVDAEYAIRDVAGEAAGVVVVRGVQRGGECAGLLGFCAMAAAALFAAFTVVAALVALAADAPASLRQRHKRHGETQAQHSDQQTARTLRDHAASNGRRRNVGRFENGNELIISSVGRFPGALAGVAVARNGS